MARLKFITDGDSVLKLNWVIKVLDDCKNIEPKKVYKIIAIALDDSLAVVIPFNDVKDLVFTGGRNRSAVYRKLSTSIPLYSRVAVYGTHTDNLEKEQKFKEIIKTKKLDKEEKIRSLGLKRDTEQVLIEIIKDYESKLHADMIERFDAQLQRLSIDGLFYKCEYKKLTMSEIAKISHKTLGNQGWSYCFELNDVYYFQRPKMKNLKK